MDQRTFKINGYMKKFMIPPGSKVSLKDYDTGWAQNAYLKDAGEKKAQKLFAAKLEEDRSALAGAQEVLWSAKGHGVLIILQGMDTAGKDGTIRHVMSGVNPQGCRIEGFGVPTTEEHCHDFLWRYSKVLPERGEIGIFNRSYYEDVLVVRVHPERLEKLPPGSGPETDGFWEGRFKSIRNFEKHLVRNGTIVLKFYLHISKDEQKRRLLDRLRNEDKYWKFSLADLEERGYWDDYRKAYEEMLAATSTGYAPWFIVPADYKWVARTAVAEVVTTAINSLDLSYPKVTGDAVNRLKAARKQLESE
jgi:PPK2 family polyphosphate:nucleotide phosphotransferase